MVRAVRRDIMTRRTSSSWLIVVLLVVIAFSAVVRGRPLGTKDGSWKDVRQAKAYLEKYGYLTEGHRDSSSDDFEKALRSFQNEFGLKTDGILDERTLALMTRPRCGTRTQPLDRTRRRKRFVPHKPKWDQRILTWKLTDPFQLLPSYDLFIARNTLHRAFDDWSVATRRALRFVEVPHLNETTDLEVFFALGAHNDTLPFDGRNGIVAHGFYPTDGNLHFDAAEKWTLNMPEGINLYQTAVHEIGHLLGLEHSTDYRAVMFPINRSYDPQFRLADDDIRGIRYLYNPWTWSYYVRTYYSPPEPSSSSRKEDRREIAFEEDR